MSLLEKLGLKRKEEGQEGPTVHVERFTIEGKVERDDWHDRELRIEPYKSLKYHLGKLALGCSPCEVVTCDFEERLKKYVEEKADGEVDHRDSCQKHTRTYLLPPMKGHASIAVSPRIIGQSMVADVELRYVGVRPEYLDRIFQDIGTRTDKFYTTTETIASVLEERWGIWSVPGMAGMAYQKI